MAILTNCGTLNPVSPFEVTSVPANISEGQIPKFYDYLCECALNPALPFLWAIVIEPENTNHLSRSILSVIMNNGHEPNSWFENGNSSSIYNKLIISGLSNNNPIGCIFAQSVRYPGETLSVEHVGASTERTNGFLRAPSVSNRNNLNTLEIGFLETYYSFTDLFLRPWSILTGYKGLLNVKGGGITGQNLYWSGSIKATINLFQLARHSTTQNKIRKHIVFTEACPTFVSDEEINYDHSGPNKKQVQFIYNSYYINSYPCDSQSTLPPSQSTQLTQNQQQAQQQAQQPQPQNSQNSQPTTIYSQKDLNLDFSKYNPPEALPSWGSILGPNYSQPTINSSSGNLPSPTSIFPGGTINVNPIPP